MLAFPDSYSLNGIIWGSRGHPLAARPVVLQKNGLGALGTEGVYLFIFAWLELVTT